MNDERLIELLSARADEALTAGERAELEALLAESADARRLAAQFRQLDVYLASAPDIEPPRNLAKRIVAGVRLENASRRAPEQTWRRLLTPAFLGYGLAAAAGAMLVIALNETNPALLDVPDITQVVGTMSPDATGDGVTVLDRHDFEADGVSSIARLTHHDDELVLDVRIDADRPVHADIDLGDQGLSFEALMQAPDSSQSIHLSDSRMSLDGHGRQFVVALLHGSADVARNAEIRLTFSSEGHTLNEGVLRIQEQ